MTKPTTRATSVCYINPLAHGLVTGVCIRIIFVSSRTFATGIFPLIGEATVKQAGISARRVTRSCPERRITPSADPPYESDESMILELVFFVDLAVALEPARHRFLGSERSRRIGIA